MKCALAVAFALVLTFAATEAHAQVSTTGYVFVAVDAVEVQYTKLTITGMEQGAAAPSSRWVTAYGSSSPSYTSGDAQLQACHQMALLAMGKPGQYLFYIQQSSSTTSPPLCKLTRVNP